MSTGRYDVVVIGGALAGASLALLLRRRQPRARVLIVERQVEFGRKVGEATVEVSGLFLTRVLGLHDHLARHHLPKHGLRYWFADRGDRTLAEMTEVGPRRAAGLPSFQLDRSRLDEEVLARAVAEGTELRRSAKVVDVELGWPESQVTVESEDGGRQVVPTRWVIDASGRQQFLARRLGLSEPVEGHPTAAAWGRWRGVVDLDGAELLGDARDPLLPPVAAARRLATNHFCGYGWWCWVIPLAGGETSIGVVWDKRLFGLPEGASLAERYEAFLRSQPGLRELLQPAERLRDDFLAYQHLPYRSRQYMDRGWALIGDAAAFIDPYYSPGLDHLAFSVYATAQLLEDDLAGGLPEGQLERSIGVHNQEFVTSYQRWLEALYLDKYELLGDAELTATSFLFDTGMYYLGIVGPVSKDLELLRRPSFGAAIPQTRLAFLAIRAFRRRIVALARRRRRLGIGARRNAGWRLFPGPFELGSDALGLVLHGLRLWLGAELSAFWRRAPPVRRRAEPPREAVDAPIVAPPVAEPPVIPGG